MAPKSDAYFPIVQVEGGATSKTAPLGNQETVDTPNITIAEGGGKRHKPSILSQTSVNSDRSNAGSIEAVVDGPGTANGFPATVNAGYAN